MAEQTKLTRILSLDGGGIRGIIPGQILVALEEKLQIMDKNPNARISDYFDLIAGTSTGGILSCIYLLPDGKNPGRPKFSAKQAVDLYLQRGNKIFDISFWQKVRSGGGITDEKYDETELEKALLDFMGKTMLSDLLKPCLITSYDIENRKGHFFKSHIAKTKKDYNFLVREAARATSAAPTYFEVARVKSATDELYSLIDGGMFVNNPSLCAYAEARTCKFDADRNRPTASQMMILSLGTGNIDESYKYDKAKNFGAIQWIVPVIDIMMSGVSDAVDYQLRQIYSAVEKPEQYLRISPELGKAKPAMDNATPANLKALEQAGKDNALKYDAELTKFAQMLLENK